MKKMSAPEPGFIRDVNNVDQNITNFISGIMKNLDTYFSSKIGTLPSIFKDNLKGIVDSIILSIYLPMILIAVVILCVLVYKKLISWPVLFLAVLIMFVILILTYIFIRMSIMSRINNIEKDASTVINRKMPDMFK